MNNINDSYFDGHYKEIWRMMIPEELTVKEVDFMLSHFDLKPGSKVLDLMSGYGRHALALAKKGIEVTAVDILDDYTQEVEEKATKEQIPVNSIRDDVMTYKPDDIFDLVICMGNSLNFFDAEDTISILKMVSDHLKKGGHMLINTWSLSETTVRTFKEKSWSIFADLKCLSDCKFLFQPTRIETETIFIESNGSTETKTAIDYIFSVNEMETMLAQTGLSLKEIWSVPGKKKFAVGDSRAYIIGIKV